METVKCLSTEKWSKSDIYIYIYSLLPKNEILPLNKYNGVRDYVKESSQKGETQDTKIYVEFKNKLVSSKEIDMHALQKTNQQLTVLRRNVGDIFEVSEIYLLTCKNDMIYFV